MAAAARKHRAADFLLHLSSFSGGSARRLQLTGIVLAGVTLALAGMTVWDLNRRTLDVTSREIRNLDIALADQTSRYLQVIDQMLQRARNKVSVLNIQTADAFQQRMVEPDIRDYLAELLANLPIGHAMALFGADGGRLVGSRRETPYFSIADRSYFQDLRDHPYAGVRIEIVQKARNNGLRSLVVARRISAQDSTFLGVVLLTADVDYLLNFYDLLNHQHRIAVTLLRRDGTVLLHYPPSEPGPVVMPPASPWYRAVAQDGGSYHSAGFWGGTSSLVSVQPFRDIFHWSWTSRSISRTRSRLSSRQTRSILGSAAVSR